MEMLINPLAQDSNNYNPASTFDNVEAWSLAELQMITPIRLTADFL